MDISTDELDFIWNEIKPELPRFAENNRILPAEVNLYNDGKITPNQLHAGGMIKLGYHLNNVSNEIKNSPKGQHLITQYLEWSHKSNLFMVDAELSIHIIARNATVEDAAAYFEADQKRVMSNLIRALKLYSKLFLDVEPCDVVEVQEKPEGILVTPLQIKELRRSKGMSLRALSIHLGCNMRFVRQLETPVNKIDGRPNKSHRTPSPEILEKLEALHNM